MRLTLQCMIDETGFTVLTVNLGLTSFVFCRSRPFLDDFGLIHWPVLIMYPQNMQQDVIEDFSEDTVFADHLDVASIFCFVLEDDICAAPHLIHQLQMFGSEAPPLEWDLRNEYRRNTIELYYLSHTGVL
jgi:hypothetical protein